jgi:hypothetical protein
MEKAPANLAGAFFSSIPILVDWAELIRHFPGENISFAMCWLWGFPQIGGVDRIWSFWGVYGWRVPVKQTTIKTTVKATAKYRGLSTTQLTMRLSVASVEMTWCLGGATKG